MTLTKFLYFAVLTLIACSSDPKGVGFTTHTQQALTKGTSRSTAMDSFVKSQSNKQLTRNNHYYKLTKKSGSTFQLTWGNDCVSRIYNKAIDFFVADRLNIRWDNKDFMILDYSTGSGEWKTIVLPLNKHQTVQEFDNAFCFDTTNNLLGIIQAGDTLLRVVNLQTQQKQFILEKDKSCDIPNNFYCIDTISITNKVLYYKWKVPGKKNVDKSIRLTI